MNRVVFYFACLVLALGWQPLSVWGQEPPVLDGANAFVTRWTGEAGKPLQVPLYGNYAYSWEKADGTVIKAEVANVAEQGLLELPVAENGEYVLKAGPAGVKRIEFGVASSSGYNQGSIRGTPGVLLQVVQWGSVKWESFAGAFVGCGNMNIAEGAGKPDLSGVTNMQSAFQECYKFNAPIGDWDVSKVTNMQEMFWGCELFNQPLEGWDVSNVTDMYGMFIGCSAFNQPLENWDVSKVTRMKNMFGRCHSFDQPLGGWLLSSLSPKGDIDLGLSGSNLSVSNYSSTLVRWSEKKDQLQAKICVGATGLYFDAVGQAARKVLIDEKKWEFEGDELSLPITPLDPDHAFITRWKGEAGEPIEVPLYGEYAYRWEKADGTKVLSGEAHVAADELLSLRAAEAGEYVLKAGPAGVKRIEFGTWRGDKYTGNRGDARALLQVVQWGSVAWESFGGAFFRCKNMTIAEGAGKPDLSGVTNMQSAFQECYKFNAPIGDWDVSKVTNMQEMFYDCAAFDQSLENWDVSRVTNMRLMFSWCGVFNQPLENWDVSQVTDMREMFYKCGAFNQPLARWNVSKVTDMREMFYQCYVFNQPIGAWNVSRVTDMHQMFYHCYAFNQPLENWDVSQVTDMGEMFYACNAFNSALGEWNVSQVAHMERMFCLCSAFNQPLNGWKVSNVTNMVSMFSGCGAFNQPLDGWDVSKVTNMEAMFSGCSVFNQPLGKWDVSQVTTMQNMFSGCSAFNQPLENWDVSRVTNMRLMFSYCGVFNQPLENWDVSQVGRMRGMFYKCGAFNQPLAGWNVSKVTDMGEMFDGCSAFNQPLDEWNVSQVKEMDDMFSGCSAFNQPLEKWDVSKVRDMEKMFSGCGSFDQPLGGWLLSSPSSMGYFDLGLSGSNLSVSNYSASLVGWSEKKDQLTTGIRVGAKGLYFDERGKAARQDLIDEKGWVFEGDSEPTVADPVVEIMNAPTQLYVGDTHTFKAQVLPAEVSQDLTWSVEEGDEWGTFAGNVLTVNKAGNITVKVTAVAEPQPSRRVRVVVETAVLTGITVNPSTAQLYVNGAQQLRVSYTPANVANKSVTWGSSDENVATVDAQGVVMGKKVGTATITAISVDGGHRASCEVTVVPPVALTGIAVSPATAQLKVNGTQQLSVSYTPANATKRSVTWSSSDGSIATVSSEGVVTGVKAGTATITATASDGGHRATCTVTVVMDDKPSGVESALLAGVTVSPNPFGENLTVHGAEGVARYALVNASGAEVLQGTHDGGDVLTISTSHLAAGIYWLRLSAADGDRTVQVVRR